MIEIVVNALQQIPKPIATMLLSAVPLVEISAAFPVAWLVWKMPLAQAMFWSILGNVWPIVPLYFALERLRTLLVRVWPKMGTLLDMWIERARNKMHGQYDKYGFWALFLFVAVPFPLTGVYTAATAAVALKIPFKQTFIGLTLGIIATACILLAMIGTGKGIIAG